MNQGTHIWAVPEDAVGCEPVSAPNSLLTGKLTGNLPISGASAANLTTSLRACARPGRAGQAACCRRRGDRVSNCVVGSGGSRLPCSTIAEHRVEGCDHFSHDGDDDDLGFFVGVGEAIVEGFEGGTVSA